MPEWEVLLSFLCGGVVSNAIHMQNEKPMFKFWRKGTLLPGPLHNIEVLSSIVSTILVAGFVSFLLLDVQTVKGAAVAALFIVPQVHNGQIAQWIEKQTKKAQGGAA